MTDAWALARDIRDRRTTSAEAVGAALEAIEAQDGEINAFTVVLRDEALAAAREVDRRIAGGDHIGPLSGVPVSIKDHIWLANAPATNGSSALADFRPDRSAVCVDRMLAAGAVVVGKTNNPEFCYRGVTENDLWGTTRNPHDISRTTGGSSGGAAASVAAGMVPLALGTDGGGSIRIPSAFCGVAGLKPTHGLVPTRPGFRGWPTLSVHGPIARSVRDLAVAMSVMAGASCDDPSAVTLTDPLDFVAAVQDPSLAGLRVAVSPTLGFAQVDDEVLAAFESVVERIEAAGIRVERAHPDPADVCALWDAVAMPEGYASEGPLLREHPELLGADVTAVLRASAGATADDYLDAQEARARFTAGWLRFLSSYDVLLTPAMPVTAFETGRLAPRTIAGTRVPEGFDTWGALALPANLAGLPAATLPIPGDGLPIGLQIMGGRLRDDVVLGAAAAIERLLADPVVRRS